MLPAAKPVPFDHPCHRRPSALPLAAPVSASGFCLTGPRAPLSLTRPRSSRRPGTPPITAIENPPFSHHLSGLPIDRGVRTAALSHRSTLPPPCLAPWPNCCEVISARARLAHPPVIHPPVREAHALGGGNLTFSLRPFHPHDRHLKHPFPFIFLSPNPRLAFEPTHFDHLLDDDPLLNKLFVAVCFRHRPRRLSLCVSVPSPPRPQAIRFGKLEHSHRTASDSRACDIAAQPLQIFPSGRCDLI